MKSALNTGGQDFFCFFLINFLCGEIIRNKIHHFNCFRVNMEFVNNTVQLPLPSSSSSISSPQKESLSLIPQPLATANLFAASVNWPIMDTLFEFIQVVGY